MKKLTRPIHIKFLFEYGKKWHGGLHIYPTSKGMLRITDAGSQNGDPADYAALCRSYWPLPRKRGKLTGKIVDLYFNAEEFTIEYITHEATHACMLWAKALKFDWQRSHSAKDHKKKYHRRHSERWATAVGRVCEQIVLAYQRKLARKK